MTNFFGSAAFYSVLAISILIFIAFAAGYSEQAQSSSIPPPLPSTAGVAITFDDQFPDHWFEIRDLLKKYDAHVTFYVTNFRSFNESQIEKLKRLQEDGNEIAFHGYDHIDSIDYLENHSISDYIDSQIIPGLDLMKGQGFNPVDFAYPYGEGTKNHTLTQALHHYFIHVRGIDNSAADRPLKELNSIYYQYGSNTSTIYGVGIDDPTYGNSLNDIYDSISRAKNENKILILYAHDPVETNPGDHQITYERLEDILKNVAQNKLKFYTISEIN